MIGESLMKVLGSEKYFIIQNIVDSFPVSNTLHYLSKRTYDRALSDRRPTILFVHNYSKCWSIFKIFSSVD